MTEAQDVQVEKFSWLDVLGDQIDAAFVVEIAMLKWSKARADAIADALHERHPDLFAYKYHYEQIPDKSEILRPTTVERIAIAWRREISDPERREDVEREFTARRQVVLSMLADDSGKLNA